MTAQPLHTADGFHPEFAELAEHIAGQRIGLHAGSFTPHRIFAMQAIAEIWRCATDNATPHRRYMKLSRAEALEELAQTIEAATERARLKPDDPIRAHQRDQLIAMRWWHGNYPQSKTYALGMALLLRADAIQLQQHGTLTGRKAA